MVKPPRLKHGARQERADHKVQPSPIGDKRIGRQPDQADIPAIRIAQTGHQPTHGKRGEGEDDKIAQLQANTVPIEQDQRHHAPDGHIIQTGIAQNALAQGLAQQSQLAQKQQQDGQGRDSAGHANAQHRLPNLPLIAHPSRRLHHAPSHQRAQNQGHHQSKACRKRGFAPLVPSVGYIQL